MQDYCFSFYESNTRSSKNNAWSVVDLPVDEMLGSDVISADSID
jgi:hypothetical protein